MHAAGSSVYRFLAGTRARLQDSLIDIDFLSSFEFDSAEDLRDCAASMPGMDRTKKPSDVGSKEGQRHFIAGLVWLGKKPCEIVCDLR